MLMLRWRLGVVTNETLYGFTANEYMRSEAADRGINLSAEQEWEIGTDLVAADFDLRSSAVSAGQSGLDLLSADIYDYHRDVFANHGLGENNEAWTAATWLRSDLISGNIARREERPHLVLESLEGGGRSSAMLSPRRAAPQ
jgi:hypothetical protein